MINLVNRQQEEPTDCGGERQLSVDGTSRVSREAQARICERLGVRFPGATRPSKLKHSELPRTTNWLLGKRHGSLTLSTVLNSIRGLNRQCSEWARLLNSVMQRAEADL